MEPLGCLDVWVFSTFVFYGAAGCLMFGTITMEMCNEGWMSGGCLGCLELLVDVRWMFGGCLVDVRWIRCDV